MIKKGDKVRLLVNPTGFDCTENMVGKVYTVDECWKDKTDDVSLTFLDDGKEFVYHGDWVELVEPYCGDKQKEDLDYKKEYYLLREELAEITVKLQQAKETIKLLSELIE